MSRVVLGRVRRFSKCNGSDRVGSTMFAGREWSARVKRFSNLTGRVGSRSFQISRSGRVES